MPLGSIKEEKHYYDTSLSSNMEDYIETIALLSKKNKVVRVKDIARELSIKMPSVTAALNKLKDQALIHYEKYGYIELTDIGAELADKIYSKHSLIAGFLNEILKLEKKHASEEACRLEHYISPESCTQLSKLMNFFKIETCESSSWTERYDAIMNRRTLINFSLGDRLTIVSAGECSEAWCQIGEVCTIQNIDQENREIHISHIQNQVKVPFDIASTIIAEYTSTDL